MDDEAIKGKILQKLSLCVGMEHAIDMGALYEAVYGEPWKNKINDTSQLRVKIRALRQAGTPIGSCTKGFYLLRSDTEVTEFCRRQERRALGTLMRISKIKKISLPQYLGQLQLGIAAAKAEG